MITMKKLELLTTVVNFLVNLACLEDPYSKLETAPEQEFIDKLTSEFRAMNLVLGDAMRAEPTRRNLGLVAAQSAFSCILQNMLELVWEHRKVPWLYPRIRPAICSGH